MSEDLLALANKVVGWAKEGEQVEAYAVRDTELEVKVSGGEVEQLSSATSEGVGIRVVVDGKVGMAWAGALDPEILADALADARDNATFATPDEHAGLAGPDGVAPKLIDLWRDDVASTATPDKVAFAADIERRILADKRIRSLRSVTYADIRGEQAIASSTGISATGRGTAAYSFAQAVAGEGDGSTTGSGMTFGRGWADLDPDKVVDDAILKSTRMLGAKKPPSSTVTIVLDPSAASTVLALVAGLCDGEDVLKGRTMFANRLGEQVASPLLTLVEDPTNPEAFNAAEYDAEGLACRPTTLIEGGVLGSFLYDTRWARAAGAQSTASAVRSFKSGPSIGARAVAPTPGTLSHEEILAAVGEGLYVQSMAGLHSGVDPVSGDFSVGCEGLMIRGGALAEPVKECVIASTLPKMLLGIAYVGGDLEWGPGGAAKVTLAIGDVSLAGVVTPRAAAALAAAAMVVAGGCGTYARSGTIPTTAAYQSVDVPTSTTLPPPPPSLPAAAGTTVAARGPVRSTPTTARGGGTATTARPAAVSEVDAKPCANPRERHAVERTDAGGLLLRIGVARNCVGPKEGIELVLQVVNPGRSTLYVSSAQRVLVSLLANGGAVWSSPCELKPPPPGGPPDVPIAVEPGETEDLAVAKYDPATSECGVLGPGRYEGQASFAQCTAEDARDGSCDQPKRIATDVVGVEIRST